MPILCLYCFIVLNHIGIVVLLPPRNSNHVYTSESCVVLTVWKCWIWLSLPFLGWFYCLMLRLDFLIIVWIAATFMLIVFSLDLMLKFYSNHACNRTVFWLQMFGNSESNYPVTLPLLFGLKIWIFDFSFDNCIMIHLICNFMSVLLDPNLNLTCVFLILNHVWACLIVNFDARPLSV